MEKKEEISGWEALLMYSWNSVSAMAVFPFRRSRLIFLMLTITNPGTLLSSSDRI
jgi:hypothetical protein